MPVINRLNIVPSIVFINALGAVSYDQYTYHDNDTDSLTTAVINQFGGVQIRKRVNGNNFDIDITLTGTGFSGVENTDWKRIGRIAGGYSTWRYGVVNGIWRADDYDGGTWIFRGGWGGPGARTEFRDGVRGGEYVVDKALTATGFSGTQGTDWVYVGGWGP